MNDDFKAFQLLSETGSIKFFNDGFNQTINSYKFFLNINQTQINHELISKINNSQIIMVDIHENKKDKYFIFGFEKTILIIQKSEINTIQSLFLKRDYIIFFMTKEIMDSFQCINFSQKRQTNFYNIITLFSEKLELESRNKRAISLSNTIRKCICGYLIEKSIIDCNTNRIKKFNKISNSIQTEKVDDSKEFKPSEYIEIALLGFGGSSSLHFIYLIEKEKLAVIKKIIIEQSDKNDDHVLRREINNYKNITHPFILKYYGFSIIKNYVCPIFEYVNGSTLDDINQMNLTFSEKTKIIFELILIIHYLHSNGFIYRDLKPDNVMIDLNKTLVLIDLDRMIMNKDATLSKLTTNFGNTDFVAPEIYLKSQDYTNKVDIYSLGMMIIYIICDGIFDLQKFPKFFISLKELCLKCINKQNPEMRPSISDLLNDFCTIFLYQQFKGFDFDWSDLIQILENDQNDLKTLFTIGNIYLDDILVPIDINKAIHYFTIAANQGEIRSQKILMQIYMNEKYVKRDMNKGIYYMSLLADQGDPRCQYLLGSIYILNDKIRPDINKAIHYLQMAADQNYSNAYYFLGKLYLQKNEVSKSIHYLSLSADNYDDQTSQYLLGKIYSTEKYNNLNINKAIAYFVKLSNNGIATYLAQYQLGKIYSRNKFLNHDLEKAIYYYQLAANQNHVKSQYYLGLIYLDNESKFYDLNKSIFYFSFAAEKNNDVRSQYTLGVIYLENRFVYDINKAIHYFTLAAKQDHTQSQEMLGIIYSESKYFSVNIDFAIYYSTLAANKNSPIAQTLLGKIYLLSENSHKYADRIIHYFTLAANQDYTMAQFLLGNIYFENNIVKRDPNKGIYYLKLAADKGFVNAQNNLGLLYRDFLRDAYHAIHYLSLAAKQNNSYALNNLGEMYKDGILVPRDIERAIYYYTLSAEQNDCIALNSLGSIYSCEIYNRIDIKKAIYYFSLSANQNTSESLYNLGLIYCEGIYLKKDLNKAIYYFTRASNLNNHDAMLNLSCIYAFEENHQNINKAFQLAQKAVLFNNAKAQFLLGTLYYFEKFNRQDFNKAVEYIKLAAQNQNHDAYHPLGFLYHEGKHISKNINQAIHYYKEASSFNNRFSKNNLGVIYKRGDDGVEKNIPKAILFFEEAIKLKNDPASIYNLAHIFLYGEGVDTDLDKSMNLLLKSFDYAFFVPNIYLLSLIIVNKIHPTTFDKIRSELNNHNCKNANTLGFEVYKTIQFFKLEDPIHYDNMYFQYIDVDFLYNLEMLPIRLDKLKFINSTCNDIKNKPENINIFFYEGLGNLIKGTK